MDVLKNNYIIFKEKNEKAITNYKEYLKKEFLFDDNDIKKYLDIKRKFEKVMFREPKKRYREIFEINDKGDIYDIGYSAGLHKGAKEQQEHTERLILELLLLEHMEIKDLCNINYRDFKDTLDGLKLEIDLKTKILIHEFDTSLVALGENVFAEHEEDYYLILQKDDGDKEYDITYMDMHRIIEDYVLTEADKNLLFDKYNFSVGE